MMRLISVLLSVFLIFLNGETKAGDHPMTEIKGKGIQLYTNGHSYAGKIGKKIVFADISEQAGHPHSTLTIKKEGEDGLQIEIKKQEDFFGVKFQIGKEAHQLKFESFDKASSYFEFSHNQKSYKVRVESDGFIQNHFINPSYILEKENGDELRVSMKSGQACPMYSLHLILTIFGSHLI